MTEAGRKPSVRFGKGPREKRTACYRPMSAMRTNIDASQKPTLVDRSATSARALLCHEA